MCFHPTAPLKGAVGFFVVFRQVPEKRLNIRSIHAGTYAGKRRVARLGAYSEINLIPIKEHNMTKEDREFNTFLVVVFVLTLVVLVTIYAIQTLAG